MSIETEITRITNAKAALKSSINSKGGNLTDQLIGSYASQIDALPSPKEEEAKTITPNFAGGNQVVTPTSGKVLNQVTLTKPAD